MLSTSGKLSSMKAKLWSGHDQCRCRIAGTFFDSSGVGAAQSLSGAESDAQTAQMPNTISDARRVQFVE